MQFDSATFQRDSKMLRRVPDCEVQCCWDIVSLPPLSSSGSYARLGSCYQHSHGSLASQVTAASGSLKAPWLPLAHCHCTSDPLGFKPISRERAHAAHSGLSLSPGSRTCISALFMDICLRNLWLSTYKKTGVIIPLPSAACTLPPYKSQARYPKGQRLNTKAAGAV